MLKEVMHIICLAEKLVTIASLNMCEVVGTR